MTPFKDLPIARKAIILGIVPTVCALLIASSAFLVSTFVAMRRSVVDDIGTSAAMLADSVDVAVSFGDATTVRELAGALREKRTVARGCVFDANDVFMAGYATAGNACPPRLDESLAFGPRQMAAVRPILMGSRRVGTVRVVGSLDPLYRTVATQALVTVGALTAAVVVALLLIRRLQRAIAGPIAELAGAADRVSRTGDYSLRAEQRTNDEVGRLVRSFNQMLSAVEHSERQRADLLRRERDASRLKDEFLATVSHELRTPLNAILGWTQILAATQPSSETLAKGLMTLSRNAKVQTRLIDDLIEVSRIATGKLTLRREVVDLAEVIRPVHEALQKAAAAKNVSFEIQLADGPALVSGDRDRLHQIVTNLAENALKFTPSGRSVWLSLTCDGEEFVIRVRDTGVGIAAAFLPHVFDRFRQADGSTTREHGGLGLGLAIVKELVQLHDGSVSAFSAGPGHGAEFVVRLPKLLNASAAAGDELLSPPVAELHGIRVLAVDDNADSLEVLAAALARTGAEVHIALSGAEAIEQWQRVPADVLICDLAMPIMDGFDVLRHIRALDTRQQRSAFAVALSAYASEEYVRRTQAAGFDAHFAKPLHAATLIARIAQAVQVDPD